MGDFRKLEVWRAAHELTLRVYDVTASFPREEVYGLTSQIRRSAASIPSNIAEGCGRDTDPELARFTHIALGSASELEYQLLLANHLQYLADPLYSDLDNNLRRIKRMLAGLATRLRASPTADSRQPTAR